MRRPRAAKRMPTNSVQAPTKRIVAVEATAVAMGAAAADAVEAVAAAAAPR